MRSILFEALFNSPPEAEADAPGRVNLIGDHTDYNQGFVMPMAIPQRTRVQIARAPGPPHRAYSVALEAMAIFGENTTTGFGRYIAGCISVLRSEGLETPPLHIRIDSDVPLGAGLSSSAALEVAFLRALNKLLGLQLEPMQIALLAQRAEVEHAGVQCGIMDQTACSLATTRQMLFLDTRNLRHRLLPLPEGVAVAVVHSGVERELEKSAYNDRRAQCDEAARLLGVSSLRDVSDPSALQALPTPLRERARHVVTENARVVNAAGATAHEFGLIMNASHASLRNDYEVTVPAVDHLVLGLSRVPGVFGARMTGAGFGGACVALVSPSILTNLAAHVRSLGLRGAEVLVPPRGHVENT
jgi:galactokinase